FCFVRRRKSLGCQPIDRPIDQWDFNEKMKEREETALYYYYEFL
ncbi:3065_t:CDS:1, partial [Entrophospora sp. SA101]